jgi:hippurate hydrolase
MKIDADIAARHESLKSFRRDIHRHPETAFEEVRTAAAVAARLKACGIGVHTGLAETGVVGVLRSGDSNRAIALRADMDALNLTEHNSFDHRSTVPGKMHGCGHDGHTAMLLGAAEHLATNPAFNGTVYFIFQPAEEEIGGARVMIEQGLFERFPVEGVYGMHNMPGLAAGRIAVSSGPVMAAADIFTITITGVGGHAAFPHRTVDPVFAAGEIIVALQTIVARNTDPLDSAVVSVTMMQAGEASNIIPEIATLTGSARTFTDAMREKLEAAMRRIVEGVATAHGAVATLDYARGYPATVNHAGESKTAKRAAAATVGGDNVVHDFPPMMGAEDFSYMLRERPGCYVFIGNGEGDAHPMCHSPDYDFNDDILPIGVSYWAHLVEEALGAA